MTFDSWVRTMSDSYARYSMEHMLRKHYPQLHQRTDLRLVDSPMVMLLRDCGCKKRLDLAQHVCEFTIGEQKYVLHAYAGYDAEFDRLYVRNGYDTFGRKSGGDHAGTQG